MVTHARALAFDCAAQVLDGLLWRTTKRHVAAQLHLPPQSEALRLLQFSSIEREFYRRQHAAVVAMSKQVSAAAAVIECAVLRAL
jgi:E3 ubiquitin-protein ligase SHPRH